MTQVSDWLSASSSVIAAIIAIATLLTVFVAATQITARRQIYQLGLSDKSLGPWKKKVVDGSWLQMKSLIKTPVVTVPRLVKYNWTPRLAMSMQKRKLIETPVPSTWPTSIISPLIKGVAFVGSSRPTSQVAETLMDPRNANSSTANHICKNKNATATPGMVLGTEPDLEAQPADASWVNFLGLLGLDPQDDKLFYELQAEPELVNGLVPMRWKGRDLAAICSILGFRSPGGASATDPMPLPTQWFGPLGWIQFRNSSEGCIAEFRMREQEDIQIVVKTCTYKYYFEEMRIEPIPKYALVRRLWQSIGGFYLPNPDNDDPSTSGSVLYLGGTEWNKSEPCPTLLTTEHLCREVMDMKDLQDDDEMRELAWGQKRSKWPDEVKHDGLNTELMILSQLLPSQRRNRDGSKRRQTLELLDECPGLLRVLAERDWASTRGLDWQHRDRVHEYHRRYKPADEWKRTDHPYTLGDLAVGVKLLGLIKDALQVLKPDGFYFSPSHNMGQDLDEIFGHINQRLEETKAQHIFTKNTLEELGLSLGASSGGQSREATLYHAIAVINELQRLKKAPITKMNLSLQEMQLLGNISTSLGMIMNDGSGKGGRDLAWGLIVTPSLFQDLLARFAAEDFNLKEFVGLHQAVVMSATAGTEKGILDCRNIPVPAQTPNQELNLNSTRKHVDVYEIPLIESAILDGATVLAAFLDVLVVFFWISKGWVTDVARFDATISQTVTMV